MICTVCKLDKDENDFHFKDIKRIKRKSYCKSCVKVYRKEYYDKNRTNAIEYSKASSKKRKLQLRQYVWDYLKNNNCIVCGENDPIVLEFDHRIPDEKFMSISDMITTKYGLDKIKLEINKCDVLCSNCHKRKTAKQFNWYNEVIK